MRNVIVILSSLWGFILSAECQNGPESRIQQLATPVFSAISNTSTEFSSPRTDYEVLGAIPFSGKTIEDHIGVLVRYNDKKKKWDVISGGFLAQRTKPVPNKEVTQLRHFFLTGEQARSLNLMAIQVGWREKKIVEYRSQVLQSASVPVAAVTEGRATAAALQDAQNSPDASGLRYGVVYAAAWVQEKIVEKKGETKLGQVSGAGWIIDGGFYQKNEEASFNDTKPFIAVNLTTITLPLPRP